MAGDDEEHDRPWRFAVGKFTRKTKTKGNSHTVLDLRKQRYYDIDNDETNLMVAVVFARDVRGGRKRSPESSPET
jgi:hypothetical protein